MAMDFIDSCAHSGSGGSQIPISRKWTSYASANYSTVQARTSGTSIALQGGIGKTLAYKAQRWFGLAAYIDNGEAIPFFMQFGSGGAVLVYTTLEVDSTMSIKVGPSNATIWNSAPLVITADMFHYYEFHVTLSGASPIVVTCDLHVDGQVWVTGATGNTGYNATNLIIQNTLMNQITVGGPSGSGQTIYLCDIYCFNSDTTDINGNPVPFTPGFLGDVDIDALIPIADHTTNWTPSAGTSHFALVDEIPPDDDTTYISSDTTGQVDDFEFQQITGFTGTILGAQLLIYAKKDAEGTRTINGLVGGVPQVNNYGTDQYLYDYYDYFIFPLDSDNGTAWTPSIYNAEHFGVGLSS
jgi:hypothetical protein